MKKKIRKYVQKNPLDYQIWKSERILSFLCDHTSNFFFLISGPLLPITLYGHSMVRLGKGQAILGGHIGSSIVYQAKIYSMTCSNRNCTISLLNRELSVPKGDFVAIPIPDTISGCITAGKNYFWKIILKSTIRLVLENTFFILQILILGLFTKVLLILILMLSIQNLIVIYVLVYPVFSSISILCLNHYLTAVILGCLPFNYIMTN